MQPIPFSNLRIQRAEIEFLTLLQINGTAKAFNIFDHTPGLVNEGTMFPYLTLVVREDLNPSHFNHGLGKILEELVWRRRDHLAFDVCFSLGVVKESIIGREEPSPPGHTFEVSQVKFREVLGNHLHPGRVVIGLTFGLQLRYVGRIQRRVHVSMAGEVVDAAREG